MPATARRIGRPTLTPLPGGQHCHRLVSETAKKMAAELFELFAKDNTWYKGAQKLNPGLSASQLEAMFVKQRWPQLVEDARATLAKLLGTNIAESLKNEIYQALILDNGLRANRPTSTLIH